MLPAMGMGALSPDGQYFAGTTRNELDNRIGIWLTKTGKQLGILTTGSPRRFVGPSLLLGVGGTKEKFAMAVTRLPLAEIEKGVKAGGGR